MSENTYYSLICMGDADEKELLLRAGADAHVFHTGKGIGVCNGVQLKIQTIEAQARMLSAHVGTPVLYVCLVDDIVFSFGVCILGFTVLRHAVGNTGLYNMKEQHVQSKTLQDVLHIQDKEAVRAFVRERNAYQASTMLGELLGISLNKE